MKPYIKSLRRSDKGELVTDLQNRLIELGFVQCYNSIGQVKTLTADGDFGEITETCLASFQAKVLDVAMTLNLPVELTEGYDIDANGIMNFPTWYILQEYHNLSKLIGKQVIPDPIKEEPKQSFAEKIIEVAKSQIGVVEQGGNNKGKKVMEYIRTGSSGLINFPAPWCQYFLNWCWLQTGFTWKGRDDHSGYTPYWRKWGIDKKIAIQRPSKSEIVPGSFGYIYGANRKDTIHVFLIIGVSGNNVITIEGNTNPGGGSDGYGVFKRLRPISQVWYQIDLTKLY